jgi:hypothetical protein
MAENTRDGNNGAAGKPIFSFDEIPGTPVSDGNAVDGNNGTIDPASLTGTASGTADSPRKRGRKPGVKYGAGGQKTSLDIGVIEFTLLGIHSFLAAQTGITELELQQAEAHTLALGINNVAQHYPALALDPKTQAWLSLIVLAGGLYSSRAIAYRARIYADAHATPTHQPGNTVPFRAV